MMRKSWGNIENVGDQSEYVSMVASSLTNSITLMRPILQTGKYFKVFCEKLADSFLEKFESSIFKCRPISEVGAEQMLLDTHALKTILIKMINFGSDQSIQPSAM